MWEESVCCPNCGTEVYDNNGNFDNFTYGLETEGDYHSFICIECGIKFQATVAKVEYTYDIIQLKTKEEVDEENRLKDIPGQLLFFP